MTQSHRINITETPDNASELSKIARQAAHDIRSPLSALNILSRTCMDGMSIEVREMMSAAIARINDIANDLLDGPRQAAPEIESVCIVDQIKQVVEEKRLAHEKVQIDFITHVEERVSCRLQKSIFQRVVSNLLSNAIEASEDKNGPISIELRAYPFYIELVIRDEGKGIIEEKIQEIWNEGVSFKKNGNGLGLFHAKNQVLSVGGKIEMLSSKGNGAEIKITIPF